MRNLPLASSLLLLLVACGGGSEGGGTSDVPAPQDEAPAPAAQPAASGDFALSAASSIRMRHGETKTVSVAITRAAGTAGQVHVSITRLPAGVHASEAIANEGDTTVDVTLTADASATPAALLPIVIHGQLDAIERTQVSSLVLTGAAGELDTSFGAAGRGEFAGDGSVSAIVTLADGRVLAGASVGGQAQIARFTSTGQLDTSFGDQGFTHLAHPAGVTDELRRLRVLSDGRIVISGERIDNVTHKDRGLAARFDEGGHIDASFGMGGAAVLVTPGDQTSLSAGAFENADGSMFVAGYDTLAGHCRAMVSKLDATGQLVAGFGTGGTRLLLNAPDDDFCPTDGVRMPDGSFVLGGTGYHLGRMTAVRFDATGELDMTFGSSGFATAASETTNAWFGAMALGADGKIVMGGTVRGGPVPAEMTFARFDTAGKLDASFGNAGLRTVDVGPLGSQVWGLGVAKDGAIFATGWYAINQNENGLAMLQLDAKGNVDASFGKGGAVVGSPGFGEAGALAFDNDGRLLIGTYFTDTTRAGIGKFWN